MVNADALQPRNAREIGRESTCHSIWNNLQLREVLLAHGFTREEARLASTQAVSQAVYPASLCIRHQLNSKMDKRTSDPSDNHRMTMTNMDFHTFILNALHSMILWYPFNPTGLYQV